jgi:broad specificity phosphatase PhoE
VAELAARVFRTVRRIAEANEGKTVVLALHATPIRTVEWTASGKELSHMQQIPWVTNASVSEFTYENGVLTPVKISQDEHLGTMVTALPTNI